MNSRSAVIKILQNAMLSQTNNKRKVNTHTNPTHYFRRRLQRLIYVHCESERKKKL